MRESWNQTMAHFQTSLPSHTFNTWLKPLSLLTVQDDEVVVEVPNSYYRDRLREDYAEQIETKLREFSNRQSARIAFVVPNPSSHPVPSLKDLALAKKEIAKQERKRAQTDGLNEHYTFDGFVVGNSNQFAHAAASAAAKTPGRTYNPLFIYGGVGLGKTHLLSAVGNQIAVNFPESRIRYCTSEQFTNELITALRLQKMEEFRTRYRKSCDVLLLDDVQFLAGKERTQEEFFHTFNTLHQSNRQIVMTSDQLPKDIPELDERLRSRFEWGMFCDIQPPDVETRAAILKKKAETSVVSLPDDTALFLATQIKSNVRALEGALIRLAAFASLSGRELSVDLAKELFGTLAPETPSLRIEAIQKQVAEFFNLNVSDLKSSRRHKVVALPRQIAMYLSRKLTSASFPELGAGFGGKDHTTIMHGVSKVEKLLSDDPRLRAMLTNIEQRILN